MDLRYLIRLKHKGWSNRKTAKAIKVGRNAVNEYVRFFKEHGFSYKELLELSDGDLAELFPQPDYKESDRYRVLASNFEYYRKEMTQPGCTLQKLWHEYLYKHPDGYRYTQFVMYYNRWREKVKASGILEHKAGEKLFVDFAGKKLSYVDRQSGEECPVEVFVAILPCSQYTYVRAVESQKRKDFILCMNRCFQYLGGVPRAVVSDNLKSAVSLGHKYAPVINKTLKAFAIHYGCVVDPARPHSPQDKAMVEGAVKLVYQRIYYELSKQTFFSLHQLNEAIAERLEVYNNYRFQNRKTTRREWFEEIEKTHLDSLPPQPYLPREYRRAKVQKIGHIYSGTDKNYYSVPYRYIGMRVEVQISRELVEIFYHSRRIASHSRSYQPGHYVTVKEHMPSSHQAYNSWNPQYFTQRAEKIGQHTREYIHRLLTQYRYPEVGYKQSQGILSLVKRYPPERVEKACKRGLDYHRSSYRAIENILINKLDDEKADELFGHTSSDIPPHGNIRGADHYS